MKKLFLMTLVAAAITFSCKKEGNDNAENLCPVVAESLVLQVVK